MVADDFRWLLVVLCFINYTWKIRRRHGHEPPSHTKLGSRDADRTISFPVFIFHSIQQYERIFFLFLLASIKRRSYMVSQQS